MKKLILIAVLGLAALSGCGIDGEPLTPPAKSSSAG